MFATPLKEPLEPIPLRTDEHGVIRVGGTRVTLETVVSAFNAGHTPEQIQEDYDVLTLPQLYAVIAYYLNHRAELDAYLEQRQAAALQWRTQLEAEHPEMFALQNKLRSAHKPDDQDS